MRRIIALLAVLVLTVGACGDAGGEGTTTSTAGTPGVFASALETFGSCDDLLGYYVDHALDLVGPYGLPGPYGPVYYMREMAVAEDTAGGDGQAAAPTSATGTNVQVFGVDEVDILKTDAGRIFAIVDGVLHVASIGPDGSASLAGSLDLGWYPAGMLLDGDTLLLVGSGNGSFGGPMPVDGVAGDSIMPPVSSTPTVRIVELDVSDPGAMRTVQTLEMDGVYVDARLSDGVARIALNSYPVGISWEYPDGSGLRAEREATEANRRIVQETTLDNWLPYFVLTRADGTETEGRLLDCGNVMAPQTFSGLTTLSILTFDLGSGIGGWADAAVVASGTTMYATADHTYLATQPWMNWEAMAADEAKDATERFRTQIHLFDTSSPSAPRYVASGDVSGFLLNQFSMDEYAGNLRVASTTSPDGWGWSTDTESRVTVLSATDLSQVGLVDGLGPTERIHAVRFMGDLGYVVTFRQTDPLYVLDLSEPSAPSVAGELKIPGYSAYLHPVGPGRLLGVGQDADEDGRVRGVQISLFDVSNPASPTRLSTVTIDGGWSDVEGNHHAFTYVDGLALVPFQKSVWDERENGEGTETFDTGVLAVRIVGDQLELSSTLRPVLDEPLTGKDIWQRDPWRMVPQRTTVIDGTIYTLTNGGLAIHDGTSLARIGYLEF
jgi:uncharacterized secreted protein with C-terminal beta-propeller domain